MKNENCGGGYGAGCNGGCELNRGGCGGNGRAGVNVNGDGSDFGDEVGRALRCPPGSGYEAGGGAQRTPRPTLKRAPRAVEFEEIEPWPEAVNGAELLDELVKVMNRFVVFSNWVAELFALFTVHTYAFRLREVTSYIGIESPEKECGKSTLLTVLSHFVNRAAVSSNISSSAFFRAIEELQPTLLIDEADTNLRGKDDLTGILNSGYTKRTAFVWRVCYDGASEEGQGGATGGSSGGGRVARYSCWCPKVIAGIGRLHPTLASRCIVVRMHRKRGDEECERMKNLDATDLKRKCVRFVDRKSVV